MADNYVGLRNDLGTGRPKLTMRLANCGDDKWPHPKGYLGPPWEIEYLSANLIPGSTESAKQWSAWDIHDEHKNYFGTLTLQCNNEKRTVWIAPRGFEPPYKPPLENTNLNYLADFSLVEVSGSPPLYGLIKVARVYADLDPGFPDAQPAKPATRQGGRRIVLMTKGAKIINDQGAEVVLKGVNRPSLEWAIDGQPTKRGQYLSPLDIKTIREWGANVIRIPLNRDFWMQSAPRETIGSYKQIVDAMIYYAIQNNMAVILDLHRPATVTPPKQAIDFWGDVAKTYREFGTVLFDLFNEFYGRGPGQWNTSFTEKELKQWHGVDHWRSDNDCVGYQTLLNTVREAGANNICLVGGLDYAYRLEFVNKGFCVKDTDKGNGIVYCSQLYNGRGTEIKDDSVGIDGLLYGPPLTDGRVKRFDENFKGVLNNFPVMITEFGCNVWPDHNVSQYELVTEDPPKSGRCTGGEIKQKPLDYYKTVIGWVNDHRPDFHYTAWGWWVNHCDPRFPGLIYDLSGNPWNGGVLVKEDLKSKKYPPTQI